MNKNGFSPLVCALLFCATVIFGQAVDQRKADSFFLEKDYYSAIPLYQDLLKKDSQNRSVMYSLAACYLGLNNDENAAPYFEPLTVVVDSIGSDTYSLFAGYYAGKGRSQEAVNILKEARVKFPSDDRFTEQLMFSFESLGQFGDALSVLEFSDMTKDRTWYQRKIGYLIRLKQFDQANTLVSDKLKEGKDDLFWQEMQAFLLAGTGQILEAEKILLSLYRQTGDVSYVKKCGQAWLEVQDRPAAVRVIRSLLSPTDPNSATLVANVMKDLTLYSDLIQLYLELEKKQPERFYDSELFALYELTSDDQALTARYLDYLQRTMDVQLVRKKLLQIADKGSDKLVIDAVGKTISEATTSEMKSALEMVLYDLALKNNEIDTAYARVMKILDLTQNFGFALSASDDFAARRWFATARDIVLDVIKRSKDDTKTVPAMMKLASLHYLNADLASALKVLDDVVAKYPGKYSEDDLNTYRGIVLLEKDSYDAAIASLQKVKKKDGAVQIKLGLAYFFVNRQSDSLDALHKAERDVATLAESLLIQGFIAEYNSDRVRALGIFEGLVRNQTADPYALPALKEIYGLKHIFVDASSNYLKIYASGKRAEMMKKYAEAGRLYASLIPLIEKYSYYFGLSAALAFDNAGSDVEAMAWYAKVINDPKAHLWFRSYAMERTGDILERIGRKQEALDMYRKLIMSDTQYVRQKEVRMQINAIKKMITP